MEDNSGIQPEKLSSVGKNLLNLIEFDENEALVDEIRKHPFGLFIIYMTGISIAFIVFLLLFALPPFLNSEQIGVNLTHYAPIFMFVGLVMLVLCLIGTAIGVYLYKNDVILVTSDKIAQVLYITIFHRKISQLSIGDVQDVTVTQDGVFPRIFHYGTIVIETAGEQANYRFTYVPDPYKRAKNIVGSHEKNLELHGN